MDQPSRKAMAGKLRIYADEDDPQIMKISFWGIDSAFDQ
jgi:hypothetical protein